MCSFHIWNSPWWDTLTRNERMHGWLQEQVNAKKTKFHDKEWHGSQATDVRQRGQQQIQDWFCILLLFVYVLSLAGGMMRGGRERERERNLPKCMLHLSAIFWPTAGCGSAWTVSTKLSMGWYMLSNRGAASRLWMILKSTENLPRPHLSELRSVYAESWFYPFLSPSQFLT